MAALEEATGRTHEELRGKTEVDIAIKVWEYCREGEEGEIEGC